jgi:two-component system, NarL family, response regulator DegU
MKKKVKVYLADDHAVVRKGMMRLLKTFKRVATLKDAGNGKELIKLIQEDQPDAVILDIEMPVMGGFDTARHILEHYKEIRILILTMHIEPIIINSLIDLGVHGFISKSAEPAELETALYAVLDQDFYRNDMVNEAIKSFTLKSPSGVKGTKLSTRQIEILLLICEEYSPGEISARLNISEKTFFNHRAHIMKRTGVRNTVGLVKFAFEHGILELK